MEDNMRVTRSMTGTPTKSSFAAHLSKFAYTPSPPKGAARGSHVTPVRDDSDTGSPSKRRRLTPTTSAAASKANAAEPAAPPSPSKPTKKAVRKYAAPDVYAHLNVVTDHLEEDLRGAHRLSRCEELGSRSMVGLFLQSCFAVSSAYTKISPSQCMAGQRSPLRSPGVTSSETGHHFAHPTNKFYQWVKISSAYMSAHGAPLISLAVHCTQEVRSWLESRKIRFALTLPTRSISHRLHPAPLLPHRGRPPPRTPLARPDQPRRPPDV